MAKEVPKCILCQLQSENEKNTNEEPIAVGKKGRASLIRTSSKRKDGYKDKFKSQHPLFVHSTCRKYYTSSWCCKTSDVMRSIVKSDLEDKGHPDGNFDWASKCFICSRELIILKKRRDSRKIRNATTNDIKASILKAIKNVDSDYTRALHKRLKSVSDMTVLNARYHAKCYLDLKKDEEASKKTLLTLREKIDLASETMFEFIENSDDCQFSIKELKQELKEKNMYIPSDQTIIDRLMIQYGDDVMISHKHGTNTLVCFRGHSHDLLTANWNPKNNDDCGQHDTQTTAEKEREILKIAAQILKKRVRNKFYNNDMYPASDTMFENIKDSIDEDVLNFFDECIVADKKCKKEELVKHTNKSTSIAHAFTSAIRPRSFISPLHLAVGVALHRKFGSKRIIDLCHSLGFCVSYKEVQTYEVSAACQADSNDEFESFVQFVLDNADFNIRTLDGFGTFHYLGIIGIFSPAKSMPASQPFERLLNTPSAKDIAARGKINILPYKEVEFAGIHKLNVEVANLNLELKPSTTNKLRYFWTLLKYATENEFIGFNGFMENLTQYEENYDTSAIEFRPFIYGPPSDYSTLYTGLLECNKRAFKFGMKSCVTTLDQPLYQKARDIVGATTFPNEILMVVRLGGFHTLMSGLGSIGYIMDGSGLREAFCTIYAENSVDQLMNGHNYARSIRAHMLSQVALSSIILTDLQNDNLEFKSLIQSEELMVAFEKTDINELISNDTFQNIVSIFENQLELLENRSNTAKLWIRYIKFVCILVDLIVSERMADWELHLQTMELLIPLFHAAGRFHYSRSAQIYLQDMRNLNKTMDPTEFEKFTRHGFWTCRRTQKFFSGIFTDQTIEQTLMRLLSVEGGPFRRGVTENVVYQWLMDVRFSKDIVEGLEKYCHIYFQKTQQHVDASDARISRDALDIQKLSDFFKQHNPFPETPGQNVTSISSGIIGDDSINCHNAFEVGLKILNKINGTSFKDLKLSRKDIVKPLSMFNCKMHINGQIVAIDPNLLFQRICIAKTSNEELESYFSYELSPYPLSLFDSIGMRKNVKSKLYGIFEEINCNIKERDKFYYTIDGGMLLRKTRWFIGMTYEDICKQYVTHVKYHYGTNACVVFDGYSSSNTKCAERLRRSMKNSSANCEIDKKKSIKIKQHQFLSNGHNKEQLIKMIMQEFAENNIECYVDEADADKLIVETAINKSLQYSGQLRSVIVSEDTDILVLLNAVAPAGEGSEKIYFYKPALLKEKLKIFSSQSLKSVYKNCRKYLLVLHAFTGSDATSALYDMGKKALAKLINDKEELQMAAQKFMDKDQTYENIFEAGMKMLLALYTPKGKPTATSGNKHRYLSFVKATKKSSRVKLETLIPTENAAAEHFKRVYLQVQTWLGNKLQPNLWGWKYGDDFLVPNFMTQDPAPPELLRSIFCSCKTGCGNACGCRKMGLTCNSGCLVCCGSSCNNPQQIVINDDEPDTPENQESDTDSSDESSCSDEDLWSESDLEALSTYMTTND